MISSTSCSSSRGALALAAALLVALACLGTRGASARGGDAGAATPRVPGAVRANRRIVVFPPEGLTGGAAPLSDLRRALETTLVRRGFELVTGDALDQFLARHRIRYTGGVDAATARLAGDELNVSGVLLTSVEGYAPNRPALGLTMRLVAATTDAPLLWIDGVGRAGDDSPGLLGLGLITGFQELQDVVLSRLVGSLVAALDGKGAVAPACDDGKRFRPKAAYRSPALQGGRTYSVAVVPFRNLTRRRNAGDLVSLEFVRQLAATGSFKVIEPGVVRDLLLRARIIMEGGVSLDQVRTILGALGADLVVAGDVLEFDDATGGGTPTVNFTATMLDTRTSTVVWQSTSYNQGNDGVWLFDLGQVSTATTLTCRVIRSAVDGMFTIKPTARPLK